MKLYYLPLLFLGCYPASEKTTKDRPDTVQNTIASNVIGLNSQIESFEKFRNDTLRYLKDNFVTNKAFFINKPIKTFLDKVELPIMTYTPNSGDFPDTTNVPGIYLKFESDATWLKKVDSKKIPNVLLLRFRHPLDMADARKLTKTDNGFWGLKAAEFYGEAIIKDISLIGDRRNIIIPKR